MLAAIDLNDDTPLEADKIENIALKRHLAAKFEKCKPPAAKQAPHRRFGVGGLAAHLLCESAEALGGRSWRGVCGTNPSPGAFGATLSHNKGRG